MAVLAHALLALLLSCCAHVSSAPVPENPISGSACSWPMYGHDAHHSSRSKCAGPASPNPGPRWRRADLTTTCTWTPDAISIAPDGTLFHFPGACTVGVDASTRTGQLSAIVAANGTLLWSSTVVGLLLTSTGNTAPTLTSANAVVVNCYGAIAGYDEGTGGLLWRYVGTARVCGVCRSGIELCRSLNPKASHVMLERLWNSVCG